MTVEPPSRWWRRGASTSRHIYYAPTSNVPAILIFSLIAALGVAALAVASMHALAHHAVMRRDGVLGAIGAACLLLGLTQALAFARKPND